MERTDKSNRTRQVQFRMEPEIFNLLKATIVYDDEVHSMADLFNKAAVDYLRTRKKVGTDNGEERS